MFQAKKIGYAVLVCLSLTSSVAFSGNFPSGENESLKEAPNRTLTMEECGEAFGSCMEAPGGSYEICNSAFQTCMANAEKPRPDYRQYCYQGYDYCIETTGDEVSCQAKFEACWANSPH